MKSFNDKDENATSIFSDCAGLSLLRLQRWESGLSRHLTELFIPQLVETIPISITDGLVCSRGSKSMRPLVYNRKYYSASEEGDDLKKKHSNLIEIIKKVVCSSMETLPVESNRQMIKEAIEKATDLLNKIPNTRNIVPRYTRKGLGSQQNYDVTIKIPIRKYMEHRLLVNFSFTDV